MTRKGPQNGQKALGFSLKVVDLGISQRHLSFIMACMDLGVLVYLGVASKSIYGGGDKQKYLWGGGLLATFPPHT